MESTIDLNGLLLLLPASRFLPESELPLTLVFELEFLLMSSMLLKLEFSLPLLSSPVEVSIILLLSSERSRGAVAVGLVGGTNLLLGRVLNNSGLLRIPDPFSCLLASRSSGI